MAVVDAGGGSAQQLPLNAHVDYSVSPGPAGESAQSIAIPTDLEFSADGSTCWVAAFGSAAVASVDASSGATELLPVGNGPSGLALAEESRRLYVIERFDATVSTVDLDSGARIATTGLSGSSRFDPMPDPERVGRRLMYDAKATSGHGDAACASCHVFGDVDGIAWDLGDPTGPFLTYAVADWVRFFSAKPFRTGFHPMKGPMVTQTLRGLDGIDRIIN